MRALGLMSGTSLYGVDVTLIKTDGEHIAAFAPSFLRPYAESQRIILHRALAEAVETFLTDCSVAAGDIDIVRFRGRTVLHQPSRRLTIQMDDGPAAAPATRH